jgi:hypothetical protein
MPQPTPQYGQTVATMSAEFGWDMRGSDGTRHRARREQARQYEIGDPGKVFIISMNGVDERPQGIAVEKVANHTKAKSRSVLVTSKNLSVLSLWI